MDKPIRVVSAPPFDVAELLTVHPDLDSEARHRLSSMAGMAVAAVSRSESPTPFWEHLVTQYERAIVDREPDHADRALVERLAMVKAAWVAGDIAGVEQHTRLDEFPWQSADFQYLTDLPEWKQRTASRLTSNSQRVCLTELADNQRDELVPYRSDGRPLVFVFSGNRQAYVGNEHEPASLTYGRDLRALAEAYVARAARLARTLFDPKDSNKLKVVTPVYGALRSRHEQRLIHFALSRNPSFIHPSLDELAEQMLRVLFLHQAPNGSWSAKSDVEILNGSPFRAVTHSYGSSAVVQVISRMKVLAEPFGISRATVGRYFANGVCVQFGGYRLADLHTEGAPTYHCVLSPLDEIALGSPSYPPRYTSPVAQPAWVWYRFSHEDLLHLAHARFDRVAIERREVAPGVNLWSGAFRGLETYDDEGRPIAEFERANGHFLGAYVECARQRMPELVTALLRAS